MAIISHPYCDGHLNMDPVQEIKAETLPPLMTPKGLKVLDLCDECQTIVNYRLLIELAAQHGRDFVSDEIEDEAEANTNPSGLVLGEDGMVYIEDDQFQCRFCERNDFTKVQGRKLHERRSHPVELEEWEAAHSEEN